MMTFQTQKTAAKALSNAEKLRLSDTHIAVLLNNYALICGREDPERAKQLYTKLLK